MNLKVEKNAGNKIIIKSYENDNGYWWIMSACVKIKLLQDEAKYTHSIVLTYVIKIDLRVANRMWETKI